ncbi:hypothetical protein I2I11_17180 [Pontibacter sp. 172403-2]|uniref:SIMPL domain-containing protein n=1 Tax=Pontibacter rufus TaxID=2791028 RepID=UPI0018AF783C|nr:SIMPL domain-containing protein [Pontibacter sp. 172403-2]MBF9255034.1 hypothetical protein [Pontibacter sp. 172403-2]
MKRMHLTTLALAAGWLALSSCELRETGNENYVEVIGQHEQQMPETGYRLNLSYNGPLDTRDQFVAWADSLRQKVPGMVKTNESIYVNYMPGQTGHGISKDMYQTSVTYLLSVKDSALYSRISADLLQRSFPFSINITGSYLEPDREKQLQQQMLQQALSDAKAKLTFLSGKNRTYEIVSIEELDNTTPYGPEYYDFNRRMVARVRVKARLD